MPATWNPFLAHLAGVKRRLLIIAATVGICVLITFAYSVELIAWLKRPLTDELILYGPAEAFLASIKVSLLAGIVLSLPVILYQFWKFIEPALLPREQRWAIPLFFLAAGFFALGLAFCHVVILPLVIKFFVDFGLDRALTPKLAVGTYVDFNVKFLLVFGLAFEMPLMLALLSRAGMIDPDLLSQYRKHAILASLVLSAVVTPDATLFTMLLMAVPLVVLYEVSILAARLFGRGNRQPGVPVGTAGHRAR